MKIYDSTCVKNNEIHSTDPVNSSGSAMAYRVPKDAEYGLLFVMNSVECTYTFKTADNVFGGKDLTFECPGGFFSMYVDLNTFVQRSGEYEGCVLIEISDNSALSGMLVFEK